jgi:hypothetical protein
LILELCQFLYCWKTFSCHNFFGLHILICYNTTKTDFSLFTELFKCLSGFIYFKVLSFSTFQGSLRIRKKYTYSSVFFTLCWFCFIIHSLLHIVSLILSYLISWTANSLLPIPYGLYWTVPNEACTGGNLLFSSWHI